MGHYYTRDGKAAHFEGPAGSATTLREARKLGLVPSVTEILQVIAKPQLETWKRRQSVLSALTIPRLPNEDSDSLISRIELDAIQQVQKAAQDGQSVHDAIEASFKGEPVPQRHILTVEAVRAKLSELFPKVNDWVAERSFASQLGFGGKCDLHSPSTGIVVDWKGKDGDFSDGKKLAWDQHYQLAAYRVGMQLPDGGGANIFFSRTHPGCVEAHIWEMPDLRAGWQVFLAALQLHRALKKFDASWQ